MMDFLNRAIPAFLYRKNNQIVMIVFAALFAFVFVNIYNPFGADSWITEFVSNANIQRISSKVLFVLLSSLVVLIGVFIVTISRIVMHYRLKKHPLAIWAYVVWVLGEVLVMSLVFASMTILPQGFGNVDAWQTITNSLKNTSLVLLLPYSFCVVVFALQEKNMQIKRLAGIRSERATAQGLISFYDERGELRLSVRHDYLLLLEAADNYVCVWYLNNGEPKKIMVRTSLKRLSGQLDGTGIVRCHRSYMVNIDRVNVVRREKDGVMLDLGIEGVPSIPISQTYNESVTKWLISQNSPE